MGIKQSDSESNEEEDLVDAPPNYNDAIKGIEMVRRYLECMEYSNSNILNALLMIETYLKQNFF